MGFDPDKSKADMFGKAFLTSSCQVPVVVYSVKRASSEIYIGWTASLGC
jgi:hypothetical protein